MFWIQNNHWGCKMVSIRMPDNAAQMVDGSDKKYWTHLIIIGWPKRRIHDMRSSLTTTRNTLYAPH